MHFINGYSSPSLSRCSILWALGLLCKRCQSFEKERRQIKIHVQWGYGDSSYRHLLVVYALYVKHMCICTYLHYWIWLVSKLLGEQKEIFRCVWARFWDGALQIHLAPDGTPESTVCFSFESLNKIKMTPPKKEREKIRLQFHINPMIQIQERGSFYLASWVCSRRLLLRANITSDEKGYCKMWCL